MCNLSQGIEEKTKNKGITSYINRMLKLEVSKEEITNYVCEDFNLPQEEATTHIQNHYPKD